MFNIGYALQVPQFLAGQRRRAGLIVVDCLSRDTSGFSLNSSVFLLDVIITWFFFAPEATETAEPLPGKLPNTDGQRRTVTPPNKHHGTFIGSGSFILLLSTKVTV